MLSGKFLTAQSRPSHARSTIDYTASGFYLSSANMLTSMCFFSYFEKTDLTPLRIQLFNCCFTQSTKIRIKFVIPVNLVRIGVLIADFFT
jgi:hypothetical protein